jgi:hypothetical protein
MEKCANCGASIGNLETPFVWNGAIVCGPCHAKLSPPYVVNPAQTFDSLEDLARAAQRQSQHIPYAAPTNYPMAGFRPSRLGITVPLLIAAISDIFVALIWLSFCFGIIFTIPLVIHCVLSFVLYSKADELPAYELSSRATTNGIFGVIVGLFNTPTLICGIILLINASKLERTESQLR